MVELKKCPIQLTEETKKKFVRFKLKKSLEVNRVITDSEAVAMLLDYYNEHEGREEMNENKSSDV